MRRRGSKPKLKQRSPAAPVRSFNARGNSPMPSRRVGPATPNDHSSSNANHVYTTSTSTSRHPSNSSNLPDLYAEHFDPSNHLDDPDDLSRPSALRPSVPLADLFKDEISATHLQNFSLRTPSEDPQCHIRPGSNANPQDFIAIGTVSYLSIPQPSLLPSQVQGFDNEALHKQSSPPRNSFYPQLLRSPSRNQFMGPSTSSELKEDSQITIQQASRVTFTPASTERHHMDHSQQPFSERLLPNHNFSRDEERQGQRISGIDINNRLFGRFRGKKIDKKSNDFTGQIELQKSEIECVDGIRGTSKNLIHPTPEEITSQKSPTADDILSQLRHATTLMGVQNTRPKLISLKQAQEMEQSRRDRFALSKAQTNPLHTSRSMDETYAPKKDLESVQQEQFFHHFQGTTSRMDLIPLSEARRREQQRRDQEATKKKTSEAPKPHIGSRAISSGLDSAAEIIERCKLKRRHSNTIAKAQGAPTRKRTQLFGNQL